MSYAGAELQDDEIETSGPPLDERATESVLTASDSVVVLKQLQRLMGVPNIAVELSENQLNSIASDVCEGVEIDETSREAWKTRTQAGMDLALQKAQAKSFPWPNAANIRYPLMTTASIQFAARAYPAIIADNAVVKTQILGADPQGNRRVIADRVSAHMSWQCLTEMAEWEPQVDKLLHNLPIVGCAFKKTYFDPTLNRNRSDFVSAMDLIVNVAAPSLEVAPRITHLIHLYPHEIEARFRSGAFIKFEYQPPTKDGEDEDGPQDFYEQHRRLDLDEDGYSEPYICTVHKETEKTVRIRANWDVDTIRVNQDTGEIICIDGVQYFTKIPFIPHPDGEFYDVGFAWLLSPLNEAINTVINQLLDAGTLANTGGGFIGNGLRLKGGTIRFSPGQYQEVDVPGGTAKDNIVPLTFPNPSPVLFQMLGLLIEAGKDVASVKDVLSGNEPKANTPATTTMAIIEQGLKVFTAIYKRIHRALKAEYAKLYRLNQRHVDPEMMAAFQYDGPEIKPGDYKGNPSDVIPVSDPTMVSDMQRMARAQFLQQFLNDPRLDGIEIYNRMFQATGFENIPALFAKQQGPSPEALAKFAELSAKVEKMQADTELAKANAMKALADAEAAGGALDLAHLRLILDTLTAHSNADQGQQQIDQQAQAAAAQGQE